MTAVIEAEYMPVHFDNGTYFCEDQERRQERGRVTAIEALVECEECRTRLRRNGQWVVQLERRIALGRVDWFGDGEAG